MSQELAHTCYCRCGAWFCANAGIRRTGRGTWVLLADRSCPGCGRRDDCNRASADPERWAAGWQDVGGVVL